MVSGQRFAALRTELRRGCLILRGIAAGRATHRLRSRSPTAAILAEVFRLTDGSAGGANPRLADGCLSRSSRIRLDRRRLQSSAILAEFRAAAL